MSDVSYESLLNDRYQGAVAPLADSDIENNAIVQALLKHKSARRYLDKPVPPAVLQAAMAAAQSASSSSHLQAWSVIAVEDQERKKRLAAFAGNQAHVAAAPLLLVFIADLARLRRIAHASGLTGDGLDYLEAMVIGIVDASLAAQNAVVAFEAMGLGACYIGGMRNQPEKVAEELGLPKETFAVFGLTVGYPDPAAGTGIKPRLPQQTVLHKERYDSTDSDLASYDASMREFQAGQGMGDIAWTQKTARRITGKAALTGRDRLREALLGFGIKLQ